jgi:hypothetical protein
MSEQAITAPPSSAPASRFYKVVMYATAVVFLVLSVFLFFAPRAFLDGLGLELTSSTDFLCRRAAVLLLSVSALGFFARNASAARRAVLLALLVATGAMAVLGLFELARGATTLGIVKAVAIEASFATCFLILLRRDRNSAGR